MKKIMFVCHGNICRSPMAEFIFKQMLRESNIESDFFVASCATSREEIYGGIGNPVYPPAQRELAKHGLTCDGKRAVQLRVDDYEDYDRFVAMDDNNVRNILRIFGSDPLGKVCKLMDFTDRHGDVADPWYTGDFSTTYRDIKDGCNALLKKLTEN